MQKLRVDNIDDYVYVDDDIYEELKDCPLRYRKEGYILFNYKNDYGIYTSKTLLSFINKDKKGDIIFKDSNILNYQRENLFFFGFLKKKIKENIKLVDRVLKETQNKNKGKKHRYSKYVGVAFDIISSKYISKITINRRVIYLGYFVKDFEAAKAYDRAVIKYKLKRKLNFDN